MNKLKTMIEWLKGKKTYFIGVGIGVVVALRYIGVIDDQTFDAFLTLLGAGGLVTMRAAIAKK